MKTFLKRHIGQILVDAGFLTKQVLAAALQEQKRTRERLGAVLVRMGVVKAPEMQASLLVQKYLSSLDDAVQVAAGERQLLGSLLVDSGRVTAAELDRAVAEKERTGEKLGEVLIRLGFLTAQQLDALLHFQSNQAAHSASPLRLGELLVTTGDLTRHDLSLALAKQASSHKKLGEVLVEEGYVRQGRVEYAAGIQKMLMHAVLVAIFSFGIAATSHGADVQLEWDPSPDTTVVGYKVYYQADSNVQPFQGSGSVEGAAPIDVHGQLTTTLTGLAPGHTYYFAVTAYDDTGTESVYSNVIGIEAPLPTTAITYPAANQTVSGSLQIQAEALNNPDVAAVQFYANGVLLSSDTSAPYEHTWDTTGLTPGNYTLSAKALDAHGAITDSGGVPVQVTPQDVTPPTIAITAPVASTVVRGNAVINAVAGDDVGVARVEFYRDGDLLFAGNSAPYSFAWDTSRVPNGVHVLVAKAYDAAGNSVQTNIFVQVDNQAPSIGVFSMPATAATLTVPISSFAASDDVAVTGYRVTETPTAPSAGAAGWSASPPASVTFSGAGARTAYAWTKDAAGNVSAAAIQAVTITLPDTSAPTVGSFVMPATSVSLTVPISSFFAGDDLGIAGYLITETSAAPSSGASGWSTSPPTSFTFSGAGQKTAYAWAKDAAGNVSTAAVRNITIVLPDTAAPTVTSFLMPAAAASLTVPISAFSAADSVGVTGYLVTESSAPPAAGAAGWSPTAPSSFTFSAAGERTAYAWTKDAAGNVSAATSRSVTITLTDTTAPTIDSFAMPATAASLTVPISAFSAADSVGVTGYLVTESPTAPTAGAPGWGASPPASFTFSGAGTKTAYAWTKDAAGNVSAAATRSVTIVLPDTTVPTVGSFAMPAAATSLTVPISAFSAADNVGVTGYLVTESVIAPSAGAAGWSASPPASFTFSGAGVRTAFAWTKDAAGNVSAAATQNVTINLPDATAPTIGSFAMPATATSLAVQVSEFSAADNQAVTGYLVTESATAPAAGAAGWSASPPASFIFSGQGVKTAYAWAKDAAGNVSAAAIQSVTITLPDSAAPTVSSFAMPATATSLTVPITAFSGTDNVGVTGYLVTESTTVPSAAAAGWSASPPTSFTFSMAGVKTAYAWTKDAAGNVSAAATRTVAITLADTTAPSIGSFVMPATSASLTVPISGFFAGDDSGVAGYLITETPAVPSAAGPSWSASVPTNFTFSGAGQRTAYAWAKDAAGNVSAAAVRSVTIVLPDAVAPSIASFAMPATATSLTVPISAFAAADNVAVTGYLVTESSVPPNAAASGWSATAPASFTFSAAGTRTAYAWTKDAAGNVSAAAARTVAITLPETGENLTINDAFAALNIAAGKTSLTPEQLARLDVGPYIGGKSAPDGVVNTGDVVVILSKITGKDPAKR